MSIDFRRGGMGENRQAFAICTKIRQDLTQMLSEVEEDVKVNKDEVREVLTTETTDQIKELEALQKYFSSTQKKLRQDEILNSWKKIIYDTCYVHQSDENVSSEHPRKVSSVEELTREEIIEKVKSFLKALEENAAGSDLILKGYLEIPGRNCPVRPR
jgi:hypothetical protein